MIQATGTITLGVASYTNPLINIFFSSQSKFEPTYAVAQIGYVQSGFGFISQAILLEEYIDITNPSFEAIEAIIYNKLVALYPDVNFII